MDSTRFDALVRMFGTLSTRRVVLGLLSSLGLHSSLVDDDAARKKRKKKCKKKKCGPCRKCKRGKCKAKPDGTDCGGGATCQDGTCVCPTECCANADCGACETCDSGQCVSTCVDGQVCDGDTCVCPPGQKPCQDGCIADNQCCGECPGLEVCCTNVGECTDVRNDPDFCGQCANGQCPGGAICANGDCGLICPTVGDSCFMPDGICGNRVDPAHTGEHVCVSLSPFNCNTATECTTDASCAPATQGFRQVCVSGLCPDKEVCANPVA